MTTRTSCCGVDKGGKFARQFLIAGEGADAGVEVQAGAQRVQVGGGARCLDSPRAAGAVKRRLLLCDDSLPSPPAASRRLGRSGATADGQVQKAQGVGGIRAALDHQRVAGHSLGRSWN